MQAKLINHSRENAVRYEFAINEHTVTIKNDEIHCLTLGSTTAHACQYIQTGGCPVSGEHSCPSNDCQWWAATDAIRRSVNWGFRLDRRWRTASHGATAV